MKQVNVRWNGQDYIFRTNESGDYLFTGLSVNNQISCECGFHVLSRMKNGIRQYLRHKWDEENGKMPRITYKPSIFTDWF